MSELEKIIVVKEKKKKATFSFDTEVLDEFNKLAKSEKYNKSNILNNLLKNFLIDLKKEKK